jgi:trans-aconitate methyltransferase
MNKEQRGARRHKRGVLSLHKAQTRTNAPSAPTCSWDPETYDRVSAGQRAWTAEPIRTLDLSRIERVIDLGCGTGWLAADLANRLPNAKVLGLDISSEMITYARQQHGGHPNCQFRIADARHFRVAHRADLIVSTAALHWIREQDRVLRSCARALKPQGRLLIEMAGSENARGLRECMLSVTKDSTWARYFVNYLDPFSFPTGDEIKLKLDQSKFVSARVSTYSTHLEMDSIGALSEWILVVWLPLVRRIPATQRSQFAKQIARLYHEVYGTTNIQMVRIRADAILGR